MKCKYFTFLLSHLNTTGGTPFMLKMFLDAVKAVLQALEVLESLILVQMAVRSVAIH